MPYFLLIQEEDLKDKKDAIWTSWVSLIQAFGIPDPIFLNLINRPLSVWWIRSPRHGPSRSRSKIKMKEMMSG